MSEDDLYDIAQRRINRRNRRWMLWVVNLAIMILSVAVVILLSDTMYATLGIAFMLAWAAIFAPHTIINIMLDSRDADIQKEVVKLREAIVYEKPKRLVLNEEGEIIDDDNNWEYEKRHNSSE